MAEIQITPKYLFKSAADFATSWPLPDGYYMQVYFVTDEKKQVVPKAYMNVKVSKPAFAYYNEQGALTPKLTYTPDSGKEMLLAVMTSEAGSSFGFIPLAKDPVGTPGGSLTPTPAFLVEQGMPLLYVYDDANDLVNPAYFPPLDGDYKAEFFDANGTTPVATGIYTVKDKVFTEHLISAEGVLTSSVAVKTDDLKKKIEAQISKGGKVVFATVTLTKQKTESKDEAKTKTDSSMSPWLIGALVIGGAYLLTRKKG